MLKWHTEFGHSDAFPQQLRSDLAYSVHSVVFIILALYLRLQQVITLRPLTAPVRMPSRRVSTRGVIFPQALELRLRKIRGSLAQDIAASTQFTVLGFELFLTLTFSQSTGQWN